MSVSEHAVQDHLKLIFAAGDTPERTAAESPGRGVGVDVGHVGGRGAHGVGGRQASGAEAVVVAHGGWVEVAEALFDEVGGDGSAGVAVGGGEAELTPDGVTTASGRVRADRHLRRWHRRQVRQPTTGLPADMCRCG
jgi:hypothetical protein